MTGWVMITTSLRDCGSFLYEHCIVLDLCKRVKVSLVLSFILFVLANKQNNYG